MRVLVYSLEKNLFAPAVRDMGERDVLERHIGYAEQVDKLTILVVAKGNFSHQYVSPKLEVYATQAGTFASFFVLKNYTKNILNHEAVDLIVAQDLLSFYAWFIARLFHKPYFVTVHGAWWDVHKPFSAWWKKKAFFLITFAIKHANNVRVVSSALKEQLVEQGVDSKKIVVIPPPVDLQRILTRSQSAVDSFQQVYKGKELVTYVGRLEKEKNVLFLLEVARRVAKVRPQVLFLIVGEGSQRVKLEEQARAMGILKKTVAFAGFIPVEEHPEYLYASKVFVMPSVSESFGKAIVQASAAGVPVVAIENLGSRTTVVNTKTGYLIERGDTQEFVKKILYLLEHEEKRAAMGRRGRSFVLKEFDYYKNLLAVPEAWKKCLKRS